LCYSERASAASADRANSADLAVYFILLEEAAAIHRAQTLRFGYRTLPLGYRSLAMLVGLLFTRVLLRYKEMATTLDIKLYQGDFHL
jgi:cobalt/nickel transport system permease protein